MYGVGRSSNISLGNTNNHLASSVIAEPDKLINPQEVFEKCNTLAQHPENKVAQLHLENYIDKLENYIWGDSGIERNDSESHKRSYVDACIVSAIAILLSHGSDKTGANKYFEKAVKRSNQAIARIIMHYRVITKNDKYETIPLSIKYIIESQEKALVSKLNNDSLSSGDKYILNYCLWSISFFKNMLKKPQFIQEAHDYAEKMVVIVNNDPNSVNNLDESSWSMLGIACYIAKQFDEYCDKNEQRQKENLAQIRLTTELVEKACANAEIVGNAGEYFFREK
ncbi:MAG: hypothetical protein QG673_1943 [Pseudomonadota bacterium]|nr:hypothetical protein [Pseudomonadota bacterium]